jgi:hypothetical protein
MWLCVWAADAAPPASKVQFRISLRQVDPAAQSNVTISNGTAVRTGRVLAAGDAVVTSGVASGSTAMPGDVRFTAMAGALVFVADADLMPGKALPAGVSVSASVPAMASAVATNTPDRLVALSGSQANQHAGFYLLPSVQGDEIELAVSEEREALVKRSDVPTTRVRGHLGEWIDLVGTEAQLHVAAPGKRMQVKVEQLQ